MNRDTLFMVDLNSFEKDVLAKHNESRTFFGVQSHAYFIDMGIPEDYARAQENYLRLRF